MKRISCIIPVKDRKEMVLQAIESVLRQERPQDLDIEILVVDDGSEDGTWDMVESRFHGQVRLEAGPGRGPGPARNAGARKATGEILAFCDSDDLWHPDHAAALATALEVSQCAYCVTENIDMEAGILFQVPDEPARKAISIIGHLPALFRWCFIMISSFAMKTEAFESLGGFPESPMPLGEDWLFLVDAASRFDFTRASQGATTRRLHAGSISKRACSRQAISHLLDQLCDRLSLIQDKTIREETRRWLQRHRKLIAGMDEEFASVQHWYEALEAELGLWDLTSYETD